MNQGVPSKISTPFMSFCGKQSLNIIIEMKNLLKIIAGLTIGIIAGLLIGAVISHLLGSTSFSEFLSKLCSIKVSETILVALVGVAAFFVSLVIVLQPTKQVILSVGY